AVRAAVGLRLGALLRLGGLGLLLVGGAVVDRIVLVAGVSRGVLPAGPAGLLLRGLPGGPGDEHDLDAAAPRVLSRQGVQAVAQVRLCDVEGDDDAELRHGKTVSRYSSLRSGGTDRAAGAHGAAGWAATLGRRA